MQNINIPQLECKRCFHKWVPRSSDVSVCPNCHSIKWNEEEGKVIFSQGLDTDSFLESFSNHPIFSEDLRIIGQVVRL
jgi:hypothetical protein